MAKFFRKIRQQLFNKSKPAKYLFYAIGEILLVVIGILIALQVNNLNEQSKANEKERNYLVSLQSELHDNLGIVQQEIENVTKSVAGQRKLISFINAEVDTLDELELSKTLAMSFSRVFELRYQDGTFKELLYAGGLVFIDNDSIKNEVTSWEGRMIAVRKQERGVYDAREKIIDYLIDNGVFKIMLDDVGVSDTYELPKSIRRNGSSKQLLESQRFENLLSYHIALNIAQKSYYERLEQDIGSLLRMVEEELAK